MLLTFQDSRNFSGTEFSDSEFFPPRREERQVRPVARRRLWAAGRITIFFAAPSTKFILSLAEGLRTCFASLRLKLRTCFAGDIPNLWLRLCRTAAL
jgi:hypothetical protein